jgi:hypothetical protein
MSIWKRIDHIIGEQIAEHNSLEGEVRVQQITSAPAVCTGVVEGDPTGTVAQVRLDDNRLVTAYVGHRSVSDGDSVLVQGGRIQ